MFNPYRHLITKVTALLRTEAKMTADERRANQWHLLVKFCDTQVTIGKGDVNTIFYQLGSDGKRLVCYPDQILERLSVLAAQPFWLYEIEAGDLLYTRFYLDKINNIKLVKGMKLYGIKEGQRKLVTTTHKDLNGVYQWKK